MKEQEPKSLKQELLKFAAYCKRNGGNAWCDIPESGIDNYLLTLKSERVSGETPKPAAKYMQVVEQNDEEKHSMYMNLPKEELCKMLIACNKFISSIEPKVVSGEAKTPDTRAKKLEESISKMVFDYQNTRGKFETEFDFIMEKVIELAELTGGSVPTPDNEWIEYYKNRAEKAESILLKANDIHFRNDPPPSSPWRIESDKAGEYITNGHMWLRGFDKICEHLNLKSVPTPSDRWKELYELQAEYTEWLDKANGGCWSIAYAHGYTFSDEAVAKGKEYRERIEKMRGRLSPEQEKTTKI